MVWPWTVTSCRSSQFAGTRRANPEGCWMRTSGGTTEAHWLMEWGSARSFATVRVTPYVPGQEYACVTTIPEATAPSPKVQSPDRMTPSSSYDPDPSNVIGISRLGNAGVMTTPAVGGSAGPVNGRIRG